MGHNHDHQHHCQHASSDWWPKFRIFKDHRAWILAFICNHQLQNEMKYIYSISRGDVQEKFQIFRMFPESLVMIPLLIQLHSQHNSCVLTDDLCRHCQLLMSQKLFSFHHIVPSRHCWTGPRGPHPGWGCACAAAPASASTVPASARCGAAAPCSGLTTSPPPSQTGGLQRSILLW